MSTVLDVSDANYKEFTDSPGAVVAYGLATCEPCKQYDPILEETAAKFPGIKIGKAKMHVPGRWLLLFPLLLATSATAGWLMIICSVSTHPFASVTVTV